jgi:hypothetical protein
VLLFNQCIHAARRRGSNNTTKENFAVAIKTRYCYALGISSQGTYYRCHQTFVVVLPLPVCTPCSYLYRHRSMSLRDLRAEESQTSMQTDRNENSLPDSLANLQRISSEASATSLMIAHKKRSHW